MWGYLSQDVTAFSESTDLKPGLSYLRKDCLDTQEVKSNFLSFYLFLPTDPAHLIPATMSDMDSYASRDMFVPSWHFNILSTLSPSFSLIRMDDTELSLMHSNSCPIHLCHPRLSLCGCFQGFFFDAALPVEHVKERCDGAIADMMSRWREKASLKLLDLHGLFWGFFFTLGAFLNLYWVLWLSI